MKKNSNDKKVLACQLEDLIQYQSYGWQGVVKEKTISCCLVYHNKNVYSYINRCPHTGVNLEWVPHQFLDSQNEFIQCATHGALFKIENGHCLYGPCVGDHLETIENEVIDGQVFLIFKEIN